MGDELKQGRFPSTRREAVEGSARQIKKGVIRVEDTPERKHEELPVRSEEVVDGSLILQSVSAGSNVTVGVMPLPRGQIRLWIEESDTDGHRMSVLAAKLDRKSALLLMDFLQGIVK